MFHIILAVKYQAAQIEPEWEEQLYTYFHTLIQKRKHKLLEIGGVKDHVHIFLQCQPEVRLEKLVVFLKEKSAKWINMQRVCDSNFEWQDSHGLFSEDAYTEVIEYIQYQKDFHQFQSFLKESKQIAMTHGIQWKGDYPFNSLI